MNLIKLLKTTLAIITSLRVLASAALAEPPKIDQDQFATLHRIIKPQDNECAFWSVEWQTNVADARRSASKSSKPLFVLSGHRGSPLGNCRWSVAAARDPAVWDAEFTKLVRERCVAVTLVDANTARRRTDATREFLRKANIGSTALTSNFCIDIVAANGKHCARVPFNTPGVALKSLQDGLRAFDALPDDDKRWGQDVLDGAPKTDDLPRPPEKCLLLRVYLRQLGRTDDGKLRYTEPADYTEKTPSRNRLICRQPFDDTMWIPREEWESLVPANPKVDMVFALPPTLTLRLYRYHLNPRVGFTEGPCFKDASLQDGKLEVRVVRVDTQELELCLEGSADLKLGDDLSYAPAILGKLVYSRKQNAFTRFDLVALGDVAGQIQHGGSGFRPGRQSLGIAFELISQPKPIDYLPPGGATNAAYLK